MKNKKQYLVDLINEKFHNMELDDGKLFYILLNKEDTSSFRYNEDIGINLTKDKSKSNKEKISRIFNELNYRNYKLSLNKLLEITENFIDKAELQYLMTESNYLEHPFEKYYSVSSDFMFFESLFRKYIQKEYSVKHFNKYVEAIDKALKDLSYIEEADYIHYLSSRVKEVGHIEIVVSLTPEVSFKQTYSYVLNNGEIITNVMKECIGDYELNFFDEDLKYHIDKSSVNNRESFRKIQIEENHINKMLESLEKPLLNIKLNEILPEKGKKTKKSKI